MSNVFLIILFLVMVIAVPQAFGYDSLENTATWNTEEDGFTINYPSDWLYEKSGRVPSGEYRYVISFFNEEDTASITITKEFYPDMFFTLDILYDMYDNPEKYGGQASDLSKVDNVFSFFIALELTKIFQCDYNYEEDYGCTDLKPKALRLFENDDGLPALQVEYSYAEKLLGDDITYGYSSLATIYYLQDRPIVLFSQSLLNDYEQLRPYFVDAANSFTLSGTSENKLLEKTKLRLLSDMKSYPNSDIAEIMNDALEQTKGYSIPIIEYGQISLETTEAKNSKGDAFTSISALSQYDIPSWLKEVEDFWAEGKITDSEFEKCLSFLIDNDIIKVLEIPEPSPEPELIPEPEPIPEPEQLPPNISIANPRVVNAYGKELDSVNVSQRVQIGIDITNHNSFKQLFTFHMIIRESGYEESISGQLSDSQSLSPALSWIPTEVGIFTAELSVFDNLQNKNKLTDSITLKIRVS